MYLLSSLEKHFRLFFYLHLFLKNCMFIFHASYTYYNNYALTGHKIVKSQSQKKKMQAELDRLSQIHFLFFNLMQLHLTPGWFLTPSPSSECYLVCQSANYSSVLKHHLTNILIEFYRQRVLNNHTPIITSRASIFKV